MEDVMDRLAVLEQAMQERDRTQQELERRLRGWRWGSIALAAAALLAPIQVSKAAASATINQRVRTLERSLAEMQATVAAVSADLGPLETKLEKFSIQNIDGAYSVVLEGANFHIRNGLGATNGLPQDRFNVDSFQTNGLGNLIVGYNELRGDNNDSRFGSHNVVVGNQNNFASVGGLVVGYSNAIFGPYSTVSGGTGNATTARHASVTGGALNIASGLAASVTGGSNNSASGFDAWVGGGDFNQASGQLSSVSGGQNNIAGGLFSSVSGGGGETIALGNQANGTLASVSGGTGIRQVEFVGWSAGSYGQPMSPFKFRSP